MRFSLRCVFFVITGFCIGLAVGNWAGYERGYATGYEAGPIRTPVGDKLVPAGDVDWQRLRD